MTTRENFDVVHVSSAHPWTDNRIHYRECVSLAESGRRIALVAVEAAVAGPESDVHVITLPRRARIARVMVGTITAIRAGLATKAGTFHLHDPELALAIPFLRLRGKKVIYDAHEDLPVQVRSKSYLGPAARFMAVGVAHVVIAFARGATGVVAATEKIAERFPARKVRVVHNYPPLRDQEARLPPTSTRSPAVVYVGALGTGRGAKVMIDAAGSSLFPDGWSLRIAGTMSDGLLHELSSRKGWSRVEYLGQLPPDAARDVLLSARVGLVLFQNNAAHRDALPTKMFEYFAAGIPVVASDFPLWRSIVDDRAGVLVDETSPETVAAAIREYAEHPEMLDSHAAGARDLAVTRLHWGSEARVLIDLYREIGA